MRGFLTKRNLLILLTIVFFIIALNRGIALIYCLFAMLSSTIITSFILSKISISGIEVTRTTLPTSFEDNWLEFKINIKNNGSINKYMLEIIDSFPLAEPENINPLVFVSVILKKNEREYKYRLKCYKRGECELGPLKLQSGYPLGIFFSNKTFQDKRRVVIYPKTFPIPSLPLIGGGLISQVGTESLSKSGGCEEFFGIREYRMGDSIRFIHWPSTAKHGSLITKEFEQRISTEISIILNLHQDADIGMGKDTTLEYGVKIAGSIAQYAIEKGHSVQMICWGKRHTIIKPSKGLFHLSEILEALACAKADGYLSYHRVLTEASNYTKDGGAALLFFTNQDKADGKFEEIQEALKFLRLKRIKLMGIFFKKETFLDNQPSNENPLIEDFIINGDIFYSFGKGDNLQAGFMK